MKIKSGFVLHTMGSEYVVVGVGERTREFRGMIRLNATGAFLWEQLQRGSGKEALAQALMEKYGISQATAEDAVRSFLEQLSGADVIDP